MMCLGWANRYECAARVPIELTPGGGFGGSGGGGVSVGTAGTSAASAIANGSCNSSLWFWIAGAVIVVGGVFKGGK
jgi:hypothetical protein